MVYEPDFRTIDCLLLYCLRPHDHCEQGMSQCIFHIESSFTPAQFVVSGQQFNMTFFLLSLQSIVCSACVIAFKKMGIISFRNFDVQDARAWFPVSTLLVIVIYTGSKSLVSK